MSARFKQSLHDGDVIQQDSVVQRRSARVIRCVDVQHRLVGERGLQNTPTTVGTLHTPCTPRRSVRAQLSHRIHVVSDGIAPERSLDASVHPAQLQRGVKGRRNY